MSDEVQSLPRSGESRTQTSQSSSAAVAVTSSSVVTNVRSQDDSVFENGANRQQQNFPTEDPLYDASNPVGGTMQHQSSSNEQTLISIPTTKRSLSENYTPLAVASVGTSSSSVKTLIVMTPAVMKGINLPQVPLQGPPMQFDISRNVVSSPVSESPKTVEPEARNKIRDPLPKTPRQQSVCDLTQSSSAHVPPEQFPPATSPLPSPCYSAQDALPGTPLSATPIESDPFSNTDQIPVTCRKNHALLDKRKLGSGQRGKCILFRNEWMTPSHFESSCGLCMSKDWKRSIRYGGCTVQKLINEGYLRPHSAVCTCAVCSDDNSVTCPVRLFQPYKRRKRSAATPYSPIGSPAVARLAAAADLEVKSASPRISHHVFFSQASPAPGIANNRGKSTNLTPDVESLIRSLIADSELAEQRMWWQLEESAKSLLEQAQRLSSAVADAKAICANRRSTLMQKLASELLKDRTHMMSHPETPRTLYQAHVPAKLAAASSVYVEAGEPPPPKKKQTSARPPEEVATKTAVVRDETTPGVRHCDTCGSPAISECTGCHKAAYCSAACQEKDWFNGHSEICSQPDPNLTHKSSTDHEEQVAMRSSAKAGSDNCVVVCTNVIAAPTSATA